MKFFYEIALHFLAFFFLLKGKYWKSAKKRLGIDFPKIDKGKRPLIWVHAVSLGETKAIAPLVKKLKALESNPLILLSTATTTGFAEGQRSLPEVDYHLVLPWDISYIIRPIVKRVRPDMVIVTETDFWINFQESAKEVGATLVLANGKISKTSHKRLLRLPFLAKRLFAPFDLMCLQGDLYKRRFTSLGVPEEKIVVTGNMKLDGFSEDEIEKEWAKKLGVKEDDLVLTLGSTHDPEERILLSVVKEIARHFPKLKVLLVPRHPERFSMVATLLEKQQLSYCRLTKMTPQDTSMVILVDVMGSLRKCYQISHLAFVGGSLTPKVGGHNILEPSFYGVPVLFGPYMHSQQGFLELVNSYSAGLCVKEESLKEVMHHFLSNAELRSSYGKNGLQLARDGKGALNETLRALYACINNSKDDRIFLLSRDGAVVSSLGS